MQKYKTHSLVLVLERNMRAQMHLQVLLCFFKKFQVLL